MEAGNAKGSSIRDYSTDIYIEELRKLVTEYDKFRNLKEKLKQFYSETGKTKFSDIENDARFRQWVKGVTDINNRWNAVIENLNRFGMHGYRMDSDISSIWWNTLPDRYMLNDIRYNIDRTAKFNKNKDSISQWKPGMSEIGLFQISYKKGTVNQSILVKAATKEDAINKFTKHKPDAEVFGVNEYPNPHFGEPILDSSIKDSGLNYGTLFIDLNSPNELTASRIVQELKNEIGNNKIAEIRGGSFTPLREYGSAGLDLDFKEFKNNEWGTNHIRLSVRSELSLPVLMKMKDDPKSEYKLRAELNNKLKQFANKTIYSNKSFTMDSAIKDMPLMFKSNVNMQSLKSNIDNVKNKPNETYINSLNANIQGIIADIEEIKGYEKEGKFNESPALKFSCKNLTAQYYKLLNDPKLQGTLHKLDVPTYKNVLYAEHQAQMLSQVTLK